LALATGEAQVVTKRSSDLTNLSSKSIDEVIKSNRENHIATQIVDGDLLREVQPDLIITQELCYVCAVEYGAVCDLTSGILNYQPKILSLRPAGVQDILGNILAIAEACDRLPHGEKLVNSLKKRIKFISDKLAQKPELHLPKTFCIDWLEPLRNTGQWIPELIEMAGGNEGLAEKHGKSREVCWEEVISYDPDFIFSMPCAFPMAEVETSTAIALAEVAEFKTITAAQMEGVYLFDGQVPSRHGPRFIDVLENFAELLHPELFKGLADPKLYVKFNGL